MNMREIVQPRVCLQTKPRDEKNRKDDLLYSKKKKQNQFTFPRNIYKISKKNFFSFVVR